MNFLNYFFDSSFNNDNKSLIPFFLIPLSFVLYAIYYDLVILHYPPNLLWKIAKFWFVVGPFFIIYLKIIPKDLRPIILALHWIFYCSYHVYFVSLSYYMTFLQVAFIFSVMVVFSRIKYLIFSISLFATSSLAILFAKNEMAYVAKGFSAKPDVLINSICMQALCYLVYYFATLPKLKLVEADKQFAKLGKSSGFIMHEISKPILRMKKNPEKFEEELLKMNEILAIAKTIRSEEKALSNIDEVDLNESINKCLFNYRPYIDSFKIEMKVENAKNIIKTDLKMIDFVLENLIKNSIEANLEFQGDRYIEIKIDSKSLTLKNPYIKSIYSAAEYFEPMVTTKKGHMGVGLYISKQIAQNLGYEIDISIQKQIFEVQLRLS